MDRDKMTALLNAASNLTYSEWRLISQDIEHGFQQKLNRCSLDKADTERISARVQIELDAYFRK